MPYTNTLRSALRQQVRDRLISTFWSDAELNAYINEAIRVWNVCTGYFKTGVLATISQSSNFIDLMTAYNNFLIFQRAQFDDGKPNNVPLADLDFNIPTWRSSTGTSLPHTLATAGANGLFMYPNDTASFNLRVDYIAVATLPTGGDGDYIQIGEEDINAIVDYACFVASLKEGGAELQAALSYMQNFLSQAAKHNSKITSTSIYRSLMGSKSAQPRLAGEQVGSRNNPKE